MHKNTEMHKLFWTMKLCTSQMCNFVDAHLASRYNALKHGN